MKSKLPFWLTLLMLLGTVALNAITSRRIPQALQVPLSQFPQNIAGWTEIHSEDLTQGVKAQLKADEYLFRDYAKGNSQVSVFVAYYAQQRAGESMHSPKHCLPGAGWEMTDGHLVPIDVHGTTVQVSQYKLANLGNKMVMMYWYESPDRVFTSEYVGKLLLMKDTAFTGRTAGSLVRLLTQDGPHAQQDAIAFASSVIPGMERCYGRRLQ